MRHKTAPSDLIWGLDNIGRVINRSRRQTEYLLHQGAIKCAGKKMGRWYVSRSALLREFGVQDGEAA
jgi:hypothetical protein